MQPVGGEGKGSLLSEIYLKSVEQDKGLRPAFIHMNYLSVLGQQGHQLFSDKRDCWGERDRAETA